MDSRAREDHALATVRGAEHLESHGAADEPTLAQLAAVGNDGDVWARYFAATACYAIAEKGSELRAEAADVLSGH